MCINRLMLKKVFNCKFCKYCSDRKDSAISHERTHTGEKPFGCHICDNKFNQSQTRDIHIRSHTGEKPFSCSLCEKKFRQRPHVRTHMESAHPALNKELFSCKICQKKFPTKEYLGTHKALHSSETPFQCDVCSKSFKLSQHLRVHMKSHSKIRTEVFCNICSKNFDTAIIKKHKEEVHYDIRAHECDTCGQRFNRFSEMKRHMDRQHTTFDMNVWYLIKPTQKRDSFG